MTWLDLATVKTTPTDPGIQRRIRSFITFDRAAAGMQPKSSARGVVVGGGPSRALPMCAPATEV
ncbi:hypothetical protein Adu01nite_67020 [Paractinoplanes durhamensis]|uniref:Uncharacterized protein n=1 Tax=Paractinoplanes durhamensis TaxID=113563 RepID=A0ABQ3Z690_9ACTN|nr:hypothetical protein Adu01nite_67020 [Actinoplanes durhamensis]